MNDVDVKLRVSPKDAAPYVTTLQEFDRHYKPFPRVLEILRELQPGSRMPFSISEGAGRAPIVMMITRLR